MAVKLTNEQLTKVKELVEVAEAMSEQLFHIMENHGLTKIPGVGISISVEPGLRFTTKNIAFGKRGSDAG